MSLLVEAPVSSREYHAGTRHETTPFNGAHARPSLDGFESPPVTQPPKYVAPAPPVHPELDREALFAEFQPLVRRLVSQYGDDPELRQELPGEIFYRFCTLLDVYDPARGIPLRPYLVRCLTTSIYTWARSHWRRRKRELDLEPGIDFAEPASEDPTIALQEAAQREELLKTLPDAISRLPSRQRQVVLARYYQARSFEDISEDLGIQPATARSLLRYGLANLRRQLAGRPE